MGLDQNFAINETFTIFKSDPADIQGILPTHKLLVILAKFHKNRANIVDFHQ